MRPLPTLRQLRYLVAIAEHRHFGRAAEACFATQSTLSAGLQELENLLDVKLVERSKRRVMLTPLGEAVVARARIVLREAEDISELAFASKDPLSGPLRMGVIPTIGPYLLPRVLPPLRRSYPDLRLYLREDMTARLLDALNDGEIDVALIALPFPTDELEVRELGADPFLLACRSDDPLAKAKAPELEHLPEDRLLLLDEGHCLREHALAACRLQPSHHHDDFRATSLPTLVQMVANQLGVTLLPKMAVDSGLLSGTGLIAKPLAESTPAREIALVWRKTTPRTLEFNLLADVLRQFATDTAAAHRVSA
ncbi:hydrogen peroxide-inducible genes activator [Dongia sp.]|uniref:hydrogen peroxide-inducible genes activator n=1 Tax=Dongia sp. TaxID=1977262 RepID=UPI0035B12DE3